MLRCPHVWWTDRTSVGAISSCFHSAFHGNPTVTEGASLSLASQQGKVAGSFCPVLSGLIPQKAVPSLWALLRQAYLDSPCDFSFRCIELTAPLALHFPTPLARLMQPVK